MKNYSIAKSRRLRSTPYTSRIEKQGVTAYTVYNHMLLPAAFGSIEDGYHHLKKYVQVWDVAAERQVEISGKDSAKLVQLMTCRDLSKSKIGRCYYCPIVDDLGNLVNDPVILKIADDKWWISIADSDVLFYAKGLASGYKFEVNIIEPTVDIIAIQGPKSFALMEEIFGKKVTKDFMGEVVDENNNPLDCWRKMSTNNGQPDDFKHILRTTKEEIIKNRMSRLYSEEIYNYENLLEQYSISKEFDLYFWSTDNDIILNLPEHKFKQKKYIFQDYNIGIPSKDQMIPLPLDVIPTQNSKISNEIYKNDPLKPKYFYFRNYFFIIIYNL